VSGVVEANKQVRRVAHELLEFAIAGHHFLAIHGGSLARDVSSLAIILQADDEPGAYCSQPGMCKDPNAYDKQEQSSETYSCPCRAVEFITLLDEDIPPRYVDRYVVSKSIIFSFTVLSRAQKSNYLLHLSRQAHCRPK
jgi:hypothetical protein